MKPAPRPWLAVEYPRFVGVRRFDGKPEGPWTHVLFPRGPALDVSGTAVELGPDVIRWKP